jgi:Na+/H+ antiporter NhaD/arsenite permease-like protein
MNRKNLMRCGLLIGLALLWPSSILASSGGEQAALDLTATWVGWLSLLTFVVAYALVITEEFLHLRKSKPVMVAAGVIWGLVAVAYVMHGDTETAAEAARHNLLDYGELLLFLLSAMTYINTLQERNIFKVLRGRLIATGYSLRAIYWITGLLAFFLSPLADNLTTALVMAAVVMAIGTGRPRFIAVSCINIVVAANAGGAFSPFGDITTLMVWQKNRVEFFEFFDLFIPSVINWLVPAALMAFSVPAGQPKADAEQVAIKPGGLVIAGLFLLTVTLTVAGHTFLNLPPFLGMMTGLGLLKIYGYFIRRDELRANGNNGVSDLPGLELDERTQRTIQQHYKPRVRPFDIFISMKRIEWDTMLFFYGVVMCVGGINALGYLALLSHGMYVGLGSTWANVLVGVLSAIVDNIPVMFAVLSMNPDMSHGQWLLVTLTAGVGGSLLSIGSAAGVALMGQARGAYTFFTHLKWIWAIALGYAASILAHLLINARLM